MAQFLLLATLTDKGRQDVEGIANRRQSNIEELRERGINIVADYALMGEYDFAYIVEAPDQMTMLEQVVKDSSGGTFVFRTLPAVPMDEFVQIVQRVKG
jgi:uncharacterized protein with GYD domain